MRTSIVLLVAFWALAIPSLATERIVVAEMFTNTS